MEQKQEEERIIGIEIERLKDFENHPFKVKSDQEMKMLLDSIRQYGILSPLIVRPVPEGVYEIISGHRRKYAAEQLGYRKVPVIIRNMKDEDAVISMIDANLQREQIRPSEKAFAYKMKYDAMISFNPAFEIAFLKKNEQKNLIEAMNYAQAMPSLSQAQRIKKSSQAGTLTIEEMQTILAETKKGITDRVVFKNEQLYRFFPKTFTATQMKREIIEILKLWISQNWDQ